MQSSSLFDMDRLTEKLHALEKQVSESEEKMKETTAELKDAKERLSIAERNIEYLGEDLRDVVEKAGKHEKFFQEVDFDFGAILRQVDMLQGREEAMYGTATSSGTNSSEVRKGSNKMSKGYFFFGLDDALNPLTCSSCIHPINHALVKLRV